MFSFNKSRVQTLKEGTVEHGPVAYWMSRDQRVEDNWALLWAQDLALKEDPGVVAVAGSRFGDRHLSQ
ncbi:MAG: hypothetical protein JXA41_00650 [Deltaproteobacteria bacterium]|nr:hypothetical protein [Deltaproteobacteria bacterium]